MFCLRVHRHLRGKCQDCWVFSVWVLRRWKSFWFDIKLKAAAVCGSKRIKTAQFNPQSKQGFALICRATFLSTPFWWVADFFRYFGEMFSEQFNRTRWYFPSLRLKQVWLTQSRHIVNILMQELFYLTVLHPCLRNTRIDPGRGAYTCDRVRYNH